MSVRDADVRFSRKMTASGSRHPTQDATATACTKTAGRVSQRGSAKLECPLSASAAPTASTANSDRVRFAQNGLTSRAEVAANKDPAATMAVRPYEVSSPAS